MYTTVYAPFILRERVARRVPDRLLEFLTDDRLEPWLVLLGAFVAAVALAAAVDLLFV